MEHLTLVVVSSSIMNYWFCVFWRAVAKPSKGRLLILHSKSWFTSPKFQQFLLFFYIQTHTSSSTIVQIRSTTGTKLYVCTIHCQIGCKSGLPNVNFFLIHMARWGTLGRGIWVCGCSMVWWFQVGTGLRGHSKFRKSKAWHLAQGPSIRRGRVLLQGADF